VHGFKHPDEKSAKPKVSDFCPAFMKVAKRFRGFWERNPWASHGVEKSLESTEPIDSVLYFSVISISGLGSCFVHNSKRQKF
jgi:hypothetical protein